MIHPDHPLGHTFPRYRFLLQQGIGGAGEVVRVRDDVNGNYVDDLHAQALTERVIHAQQALEEGRTAHARQHLDEALAYLKKPTHTR